MFHVSSPVTSRVGWSFESILNRTSLLNFAVHINSGKKMAKYYDENSVSGHSFLQCH